MAYQVSPAAIIKISLKWLRIGMFNLLKNRKTSIEKHRAINTASKMIFMLSESRFITEYEPEWGRKFHGI